MTWLSRRLRELRADERGATLVTTAMLLTVLLGFVGLGLDLGIAVAGRRTTQNAADAAALSGAVALSSSSKDVVAEAQTVAAQYGLVNSPAAHVTVAVNNPPASGLHVGDTSAVEVVITRPGVGFFSTLFVKTVQPISARAVAVVGQQASCMLALNPSATGAISINGTPKVNMPDCAIYADSSNTSGAIIINGSPTINVAAVDAVGHVLMNGITVPNANDNSPAVADPYAGTQAPSPGGCSVTSKTLNNQTATFDAGSTPFVFCGGLTVNGNSSKVTFGPGVYIFSGGDFVVNGTDDLVNTAPGGATFIFENDSGLVINGSVQGNMSAPTTGATAGLLFFAPAGGPTRQMTLNGDSKQNLTIEGAIYAPDRLVTLNGGINDGGCAELIAGKISINGTVQMDNKCAGTAVKTIGGPSKLVE